MPWDELKPQAAFLRNLDWDHVNRQLAQAEAAKRGADESGAREAPEYAPAQ